jgi:superfamily II DNA helicase RecQ
MVAGKRGKEAEVAKSIETEKALLETTTAKRCRLKLKLATENEERPKPVEKCGVNRGKARHWYGRMEEVVKF